MPVNPRDYAIVIGINDYPNYRHLQGPVQDAKDFAAWLLDDQTGGGVPPENCHAIYSNANPLYPTKDDIDLALSRVYTQARGQAARRFYFYFAGHGQSNETEDTNLCLGRWSTTLFSGSAISAREHYKFVVNCVGFQEVVILLDCCRVRVVAASGLPPGVSCPRAIETAGQVRMFKAYATEFQSLAFEAAAAGSPGVESAVPLVQGHFTRALLAGLRGGAASPGGGVKAARLKEYLEREVPRIAQDFHHDQQARVPEADLLETSLFGSALPPSPSQVGSLTIRFSPLRLGMITLYGPSGSILRQGDASTGPWELSLERGTYLLVEESTREEKGFMLKPEEVRIVDF